MPPKRRGLALTIIGLIVAIPLAIAIFVGSIGFGAARMTHLIQDAAPVPSGGSLQVAAGTPVAVFTTARTRPCAISTADGQDVSYEIGYDASGEVDNQQWQLSARFTTAAAGAYTVDCGVDARVATGADAKNPASSAIWAVVGGFVGSGIAFLVGLVLAIVGIVKLVGSGRERRQWQAQSAYAGGQTFRGGYGPPPVDPQDPYGPQPYRRPGDERPPQQ